MPIKVGMLKTTAMSEVKAKTFEQARWGWFILFTSSTTLVCCAMPILLVALALARCQQVFFLRCPF